MIEISNSVRRRLGAVPEPQTHPETDILAAYAENALRRGERERTMEHLAVCASCREVIALATLPVPPSRAEATETKGVPAWSWKGWFAGRSLPALRWAAVAVVAGVTTIVMVEKPWNLKSGPEPLNHAVLIHEGQPASPTAASPETSNTGTPDVAEKAAAPLMAKTEAGAKTPEATDRMTARNVQPPQEVIRRTGVSVLPLGGHRSVIEDKSEPVPPVAVANNSHQDFLNLNRFNSVDAGVEVASQTVALAPSLPFEAANGSPARSFSASRTVPPLSLSSVNSSAFSTAGAMEARPASTAGGDTLKTLRSALKISGRMARFARNKTYSESLPGSGFFSATRSSAADRNSPTQAALWSVSPEGKLLKSLDATQWLEAYAGQQEEGLRFRVVAALGQDVWAGGNHMTLVHSADGGANWEKLRVGDTGWGDITKIIFENGSLQVQTISNQTWASWDGGKTWTLLKQ